MIVQNLFQRTSFDKIWDIFVKSYYTIEPPREGTRDAAQKAYKDILQKTPSCSNDVVFATPYQDDIDESVEFDVFVIKEADLPDIKKLHPFQTMKELEDHPFIHPGYALMGIPRDEVLGYQVAEECITEENLNKVVASVFWEMTWFGWDEETAKINEKKTFEDIDDLDEQIQNAKPLEEVMQELRETFGIEEETEEEKAEQFEKAKELGFKNINEKLKIFEKWGKNH